MADAPSLLDIVGETGSQLAANSPEHAGRIAMRTHIAMPSPTNAFGAGLRWLTRQVAQLEAQAAPA